MKNWICLNCLRKFKKHEITPFYEKEDYTVDIDHHVTIDALKAKCPLCGDYLANDSATDFNLSTAYNKYEEETKLGAVKL